MASTNGTPALGSLAAAEEALRQLPNGSVKELKSYNKPPMSCLSVFEGLGVLLEPSKKKWEWTDDKTLMGGDIGSFRDRLLNFDKDHISDEQLTRLEAILGREECEPEVVASISQACHAFCLWLRAIMNYAKQRGQAQ